MGSKSKYQKTIENVEVDRISNLPDTVLGHIFSSLSTKNAVATSILSKRWEFLWTYINNLDFNFPHNLLPVRGDCVPEITSFMNYVDRVLNLCTSEKLQNFRLCNCQILDPLRVNAWINEAIRRNVRELDLEVPQLPLFVFICKTLTVLKLKDFLGGDFDIPTSFCLPNLKILRVERCRASPNDLMQKFFSSCPILEDVQANFSVEDFINKDDREFTFFVSAPALKRLVISILVEYRRVNCQFVFNAPNLEYINVFNNFFGTYVVENLSSLDEARVNVGVDSKTLRYVNPLTYDNRAVELLRGLARVKSLSLYNLTMSALDFARMDALPTFDYLNHLELVSTDCRGRKVIPGLLESSPNLETLIIKKEPCGCYLCKYNSTKLDKDFAWKIPQSIPICLLTHIKMIKFILFEQKKYVQKLVKYLLKHAEVLETLIIEFPPQLDASKEAKFRKILLEFPRASRTCRIQFNRSMF